MPTVQQKIAMAIRKQRENRNEELRGIGYSSSGAKIVAIISYCITCIPLFSFIGLFVVQDTVLRIIFGIFVFIALIRVFLNAHVFKALEFKGKELILKLKR